MTSERVLVHTDKYESTHACVRKRERQMLTLRSAHRERPRDENGGVALARESKGERLG
jgi:hypothetical protein